MGAGVEVAGGLAVGGCTGTGVGTAVAVGARVGVGGSVGVGTGVAVAVGVGVGARVGVGVGESVAVAVGSEVSAVAGALVIVGSGCAVGALRVGGTAVGGFSAELVGSGATACGAEVRSGTSVGAGVEQAVRTRKANTMIGNFEKCKRISSGFVRFREGGV